jgi:hypothetical protein
MDNFEQKFQTFLAGATKIYNDYMDANFPNNQKDVLIVLEGKRYKKVCMSRDGGKTAGCAHIFVDKTNGDVLKPASWSAPAKGARGNIFDTSNGLSRMTAYGPEYNRG